MSYVEPMALCGQTELDQVGMPASDETPSRAGELFLERLRAGDAAAFEHLVAERTPEVFGLLYRLTEDAEEARDLTQETFLRAFQYVHKFRGDSDLKTWLYRIAINQARNRWRWWRRRKRDVTVSLDATEANEREPLSARLPAAERDPESKVLAREREAALREALRDLGAPYREAVILRDIEGLSYEEIAVTLEVNVGTVKSRISRGRIDLRKRLNGKLGSSL